METPQNNPKECPDAGNACVICFEHISIDTKAVIKNCAHEFCFSCIKSWTETTTTCPLCKQQFDVLHHSFTSDGSYQEEKIDPPNINRSDSGGHNNVEEQLQCLDHSFFIAEVQRLLQDAERMHRQLWQANQSHRGLAPYEKQQLETLEGVVAELRNHKRKLQALLQFEPHTMLQDLYRLQDLLRASYGAPVIPTYSRARSPVRYGADDADAAAELSDEDDFTEDMAYMNLGKSKKPLPLQAAPRRRKSKARTPANLIGQVKAKKGQAN